ncbi:MAG: acyl carrier protein [Pseudobdellovibrio sp.]
MSDSESKFEKLFIKTMNLSANTDLESAKYGQPANWDSIRHVELFIYITRDFKVSFSAREITELNTYAQLKQALLHKLGET